MVLARPPPAVGEPALDRAQGRWALLAVSQGCCKILCHAPHRLSGCEAPFGLESELRPGVRAGTSRHTRLRGAEQARERLVAATCEAAGRAPNVHEAGSEVASRSPCRELSGAMECAEPDAHAVRELNLGSRSLPGARTDRAGRRLPEALPLVVAHRHGPTVTGHVQQRTAHMCQSRHYGVALHALRRGPRDQNSCGDAPVGVTRTPTGARTLLSDRTSPGFAASPEAPGPDQTRSVGVARAPIGGGSARGGPAGRATTASQLVWERWPSSRRGDGARHARHLAYAGRQVAAPGEPGRDEWCGGRVSGVRRVASGWPCRA